MEINSFVKWKIFIEKIPDMESASHSNCIEASELVLVSSVPSVVSEVASSLAQLNCEEQRFPGLQPTSTSEVRESSDDDPDALLIPMCDCKYHTGGNLWNESVDGAAILPAAQMTYTIIQSK